MCWSGVGLFRPVGCGCNMSGLSGPGACLCDSSKSVENFGLTAYFDFNLIKFISSKFNSHSKISDGDV